MNLGAAHSWRSPDTPPTKRREALVVTEGGVVRLLQYDPPQDTWSDDRGAIYEICAWRPIPRHPGIADPEEYELENQ